MFENGASDLSDQDSVNINAILNLPGIPFFLSGDNHGMITMWSLAPILDKYMNFHTFKLSNIETNSSGEERTINSIITNLEWNPNND